MTLEAWRHAALRPEASVDHLALTGLLGDKSNGNQRLLSKFQLGATEEVLRGLAAIGDQGCIVTAGTGSGKTLAFYLPIPPTQGQVTHRACEPRGEGGVVLGYAQIRGLCLLDWSHYLVSKGEVKTLSTRSYRVRDGRYPIKEVKALQFSDTAEQLDAASEACSGPKSNVRQRVNTG